jgi:hypothetical protein
MIRMTDNFFQFKLENIFLHVIISPSLFSIGSVT